MIPNRDCAAVYVASSQEYVKEALESARSLRRVMPEVAVYLKAGGSASAAASIEFDMVQTIGNVRQAYIDKYCFLDGVREPRVLFLDSDTYICGSLQSGFDVLTKFEMACAHAPYRICPHFAADHALLEGIPDAFPELNTGVIFCRNTPRLRSLFRSCIELHEAHADIGANDQPAFRRAVWHSDVSLSVLPPEYNARMCFPVFLSGEAKILHFRSAAMAGAAEQVNVNRAPRTFVPNDLAFLTDD